MKCHFLGTGGSVNSQTRHNTALFIESAHAAGSLLVDVNGVCVQRLTAAGIDFAAIEHIFLTHEHIDHVAALPNLLHQMWVKGCLYNPDCRRIRPLHIYANAPTLATVRALLAAVKLPAHPHMFPYHYHELSATGGTLAISDDGPAVTYFPVNHGPTPCNGLYVDGPRRRLVYSADTEPVAAIYACLRAGDVLVHDCNKIDIARSPEHTSWAEIEALLPDLPPAITTYLVHLPPLDAGQGASFSRMLAASYGDRVVAAADGLVIPL